MRYYTTLYHKGLQKCRPLKLAVKKKLAENSSFIKIHTEIGGPGFDSRPGRTLGGCSSTTQGMNYLKSKGFVIFLDLPQKNLEDRITNFSTRGIARRPDQSFACLFDERRPLYLQHADIIVDCLGLSIDQLLKRLITVSSEHLIA